MLSYTVITLAITSTIHCTILYYTTRIRPPTPLTLTPLPLYPYSLTPIPLLPYPYPPYSPLPLPPLPGIDSTNADLKRMSREIDEGMRKKKVWYAYV
jgi:hypothetical protein